MKKLIPKNFNFQWIKNTSFKYNIIGESNYAYEYIFNFLLFLLFVVILLFVFFKQYSNDLITTRAQMSIYLMLNIFFFLITSGIIFSLNFLFSSINIKNLFKIKLLIKNCSTEDINTLRLLRSYYRLLLFINIAFCFSVAAFYTSCLFHGKFVLW